MGGVAACKERTIRKRRERTQAQRPAHHPGAPPSAGPGWLGSLGSGAAYAPSLSDRSRNALATTDTELRLMAAAATIGLSSRWLDSG